MVNYEPNALGTLVTLPELFGPQGHITWWQECNRSVVVFFFGLALVRISGRRVFGKWSALDIVVSIIIGSSLSRAVTGSAALGGTMAASAAMMALHWVLAHVAAWSPRFARIVEGKSIELARDGRTDRDALLRDAITRNDLLESLRQSGVADVESARRVVLEPSGKITAVKKG